MRFKRVVLISMIIAGTVLVLILLIGLVVPASVLNKLGKKPVTVTQVTTTSDGKQVVETVNPNTGEKVITTTDPNTGQTTTTTVNKDGSTNTSSAASTGAAATPATSLSAPANNSGTTPPGGATGGSAGGTSKPPAPVVTLTASPGTITVGSSSTLSWSATNAPSSCTASGSWSGAKAVSGSQAVNPSSTASYTLSCTNAGGTGTKAVNVTVNAAAACGQAGGTCHSSDITGHNSSADCRSAINASGSGLAAYAISSSFLTLHQPKKSITNTLCGRVYSSNLANFTSDHRNGATLGGSAYQTWINNFYLGPYN